MPLVLRNTLRPILVVLIVLAGGRLGFGQDTSPLLNEPETVEEAFKATVLMVDLARPTLARRYLQKMVSLKPDDETLLELRTKYGVETFLRLSNVEELQPLSTQLLQRLNAAFRQRATDPTRTDALIRQLLGTPKERAVAIVSLRGIGPEIVPRMLQLGAGEDFEGRENLVSFALTRMGAEMVPPLLGALDSPVEEQKSLAIEALGFLADRSAVKELWYYALGEDQPPAVRNAARVAISRIEDRPPSEIGKVDSAGVVHELKRLATAHFAREVEPARTTEPGEPEAGEADDAGEVVLWSWRALEGRVGRVGMERREASNYLAAKYAYQALALSPGDAEAQALYLASSTALDLGRNGWDRGLTTGKGTPHDTALTAGPAASVQALRLAARHRNALAALAALRVLAQVGDSSLLYSKGSTPAPLAAALDYPDPRVQFAAANTILQIDPRERFSRAHRVVEVLTRALNDDGRGGVAVVDASVQRGSTMAGVLSELGFDAELRRTGRSGFKLCASRNDLEFVAVEANVARWGLSQTIANLRADARTAATPIVVYGVAGLRNRIQRLLARYPDVHFVETSIRDEVVKNQMRPILEQMPKPLTPEQRAEQVSVAAFWFAHIANGRRTELYDISPAESALFGLLDDPELSGEAITALGAIATPTSQERLQEVVMDFNRPVPVREQAALQLAFHVQRFGLLLSKTDVLELQNLYGSTQEPRLATALASVVGSFKPDERLAGKRLLEGTPPAAVPATVPEGDAPMDDPFDAPMP